MCAHLSLLLSVGVMWLAMSHSCLDCPIKLKQTLVPWVDFCQDILWQHQKWSPPAASHWAPSPFLPIFPQTTVLLVSAPQLNPAWALLIGPSRYQYTHKSLASPLYSHLCIFTSHTSNLILFLLDMYVCMCVHTFICVYVYIRCVCLSVGAHTCHLHEGWGKTFRSELSLLRLQGVCKCLYPVSCLPTHFKTVFIF